MTDKTESSIHETLPLHKHARMEIEAIEALKNGQHAHHEEYDHLTMMGELLNGLAHELRNPIAGIRAAVQTLARRVPKDDPTYPVYENICETADRLETLTRNLLSFARSGKAEFTKTDMNQVIGSTIAQFESSKHSDTVIHHELEDNLPEVFGNEKLLQQVLFNLFNNAQEVKTEELDLSISTHYVSRTHTVDMNLEPNAINPFRCQHGVVQIRVKDNGPGVPNKELNNIFRPFYSTKENGAGFGLYFCMQIIRQHRGCLFARNNESIGMSFVICLPIFNSKTNSDS